MSSSTTSLLHYIPTMVLFIGQALSEHTHHQHYHHHHVRQVAVAVPIVSNDATPTATIQATRVPEPASSEVISDLKDIQKGIDDLPGSLLSYIQSVEQRLETVESLLQSLLSSSAPTSLAALPSAPAVEVSTSRRDPAPFITAAAPASSTIRSAVTTSSSFHATTFRTSRVTSTRTSIATVTKHMPIPVFSTGGLPRPYVSVSGNGSLATPTARSTGTKAMTLTVAVLPAPSTITIPGLSIGSAPTTFATLTRSL